MSYKNLQKILEGFDFQRETTLPEELREAVEKGVEVFDSKGQNGIQAVEIFYEDRKLRESLIRERGYQDTTQVAAFYAYDAAKKVYYSLTTGERLGDELGINDWLLFSQ